MKKIESMRDAVSSWPSYEYVKNHEAAGWRIAAIEWQREVDSEAAPDRSPALPTLMEEIPYGTRIAADCLHLQENPTEMQILNHLAEMVVQDLSYARMAESLNQRGFRTRDGKAWTSLAVFKLTPRLIEVAPRILSGTEWESRKRQLSRVAWNS
jgi:Recombinase